MNEVKCSAGRSETVRAIAAARGAVKQMIIWDAIRPFNELDKWDPDDDDPQWVFVCEWLCGYQTATQGHPWNPVRYGSAFYERGVAFDDEGLGILYELYETLQGEGKPFYNDVAKWLQARLGLVSTDVFDLCLKKYSHKPSPLGFGMLFLSDEKREQTRNEYAKELGDNHIELDRAVFN